MGNSLGISRIPKRISVTTFENPPKRTTRDRIATDSKRRSRKRMSFVNKESRDDSKRSDNIANEEWIKQNHLLQLRNITAKLLREESEIRSTSSFDGAPTAINRKNRHRCKPTNSESIIQQQNHVILSPWVEKASSRVSMPWDEVEASPIEIVSVHEDPPVLKPQQPRDSPTESTALCSALEMLSLEYFCNGGVSKQQQYSPGPAIATAVAARPIKVVGNHSPAHDDHIVVPREITFATRGFCGCATTPLDEEVRVIKRSSKKNSSSHKNPAKFMKRLRPFKNSKNIHNSTKVVKVKVYVDTPKQNHMGSNGSIGNSTLTMPKELQRSSSSTTI